MNNKTYINEGNVLYSVHYYNANAEEEFNKVFNTDNSKKSAEEMFVQTIYNDEELRPIITEGKTDVNMHSFDEIVDKGYLLFMENGNNIELEIMKYYETTVDGRQIKIPLEF